MMTLPKTSNRAPISVASALSLFIAGLARAQADIRDVVARAKPAVVQIVAYDDANQSTRLGTGWFLDNGDVVTNFHVIAGADLRSVYAKDNSGELLKLQTLKYWAFDPDLVGFTVICVTGDYKGFISGGPSLSLHLGDSSAAREGERVIVIGNPEGLYGTVSDGIISAFRDNGNIIQITAPISPGSSGSPVLNEKGEVIGIATAVGKEGQNLNFAVSSNALDMLMTKHFIIPVVESQARRLNDVPAKQADLRKIEPSLNKAYGDLWKLLGRQQQILLAEDQAVWLLTRPVREKANSSAFYEMTRRRADEFRKLCEKYRRQ